MNYGFKTDAECLSTISTMLQCKKERKENNDASFIRDGGFFSSKWSTFILREKSLDNRVHMFSVTVGSSKTVYAHEQLSVKTSRFLHFLKPVHRLTQQSYFRFNYCTTVCIEISLISRSSQTLSSFFKFVFFWPLGETYSCVHIFTTCKGSDPVLRWISAINLCSKTKGIVDKKIELQCLLGKELLYLFTIISAC